MAGTAKHYIFYDGRQRYVDHAATAVMQQHIRNQVANIISRDTRLRVGATLDQVLRMTGTWRSKLLGSWAVLKPLLGNSASLTEYRVRPNSSFKSCKFRQIAREYRTGFKPTKGRKKIPAPRFRRPDAPPMPATETVPAQPLFFDDEGPQPQRLADPAPFPNWMTTATITARTHTNQLAGGTAIPPGQNRFRVAPAFRLATQERDNRHRDEQRRAAQEQIVAAQTRIARALTQEDF